MRAAFFAKEALNQPGLAARKAALAMVCTVLGRRQTLDFRREDHRDLSPRDQGFARALASQSLRHLGVLDAVLQNFLQKRLAPHKSGTASEILLLGACELLILKVGAHAAVDGANRLAAQDSKTVHFKPLINAILRRVAQEGEAILARLDRPRLAAPDWLWTRWTAQYGENLARSIAEAHLHQAPTDIVLKPGVCAPGESVRLFGPVYRLSGEERVEVRPGFCQGDWWVQDAAAVLPALLLGDVRGKSVLDLCAAPGGKTLQLAAAGAKVVAVDSDKARATRIAENLARTKLAAEIVVADARDLATTAPLVLIDAPCSGTGTIRRHPELPWIKSAADVMACTGAAYEILESGARLVEAGGILVFAVCSLEREEGEEQIAAFLSAHPEFSRQPVAATEVFGHSEWITAEGALRSLPCHLPGQGGMDGFYAVRLQRNQQPA